MTDSRKLDLLLDAVTSMQGDVVEIKGDVKELKQDVSELKQDVADLKVRLDAVESKIKVIELNLENEIRVNIKRIAEAHLDLWRKLEEAKKPNQEMEILGIKVRNNESEIRNIKGTLKKYALI